MTFRTRKPFKQADNFLQQFEAEQPVDYPRLVDLISAFKVGDVDKMEVFGFIVAAVKKSPDLLAKFNAFLNPDKQIALLSDWRIKKLIEHLMKKTNEWFRTDARFNNFINLFQAISSKMDEDGIVFTSYDEAFEFFASEMSKEESMHFVGADIIAAAQKILQEYIVQVKVNPPEEEEERPEPKALPSSEKAPLTEKGKKAAEAAKKNRPQKTGEWSQAQKTGKAVAKPAVAAPKGSDADHMDAYHGHSPKEGEETEDRKPENLKIEQNVFKAIRRRIGEADYLSLMKMVDAYRMNVLSYFEWVKLIEQILVNVDKKLLLLLREIVESRDQKRTTTNVFNLKQCNEEIPNQTDNFSYNRAIYRFDLGPPETDQLINKTFVGIATGNEAATNYEDAPLKKVSKNASEEIMFKVEDEIHEFDSNIAQIRVSLRLIERLQKEKVSAETAQAICAKLKTVRALGLIYGNKAPKMVEKLRQKPKELMELILERLREKLELLLDIKRDFVDKGWTQKFTENYYKALDARSNSIKAYEKVLIGHRHVLQSLKNARNDGAGVVFSNTLNELMFNRPETRVAAAEVPQQPSAFRNPVFCFTLGVPEVAKDVLHLIGVTLKQGKTNFDKKKCWFFLRKAFLNFLQVDDSDCELPLVLDDSETLKTQLEELEKLIFPQKDFYYHQKIKVEFVKENCRNFGPEMLREFAFQELFRPDAHAPDHLQQTPTPLPRTPIELADGTAPEQSFPDCQVATRIEDFGPVHDPTKIFFSDPQMFLAFKYFFLLYERLLFVREYSHSHCGDARVYQVFYSLLVYHLLGEIDYVNFENAVVTLFDKQSGVLLNFDRIIQHFFKSVPNDELYSFVCRLNPAVFSDAETSETEAVVFAKTCQKICELHSRENKGQKNQYTLIVSSDAPVEVLKFEFVPETRCLLVHHFEGIFRTRGKEVVSSQKAFLEDCGDLLTRVSPGKIEMSLSGNKVVRNNQVFSLNATRRQLVPVVAESEDTITTVKSSLEANKRGKRIVKLKKIIRFWQERQAKGREEAGNAYFG